jgi:glycerophosphoryl diester phosphodiesterase
MIEKDNDIKWLRENYPSIPICVGHDFDRNWAIVDRAIETGAQKVQFFKPYVNREMIEKAHAHGIICNLFWADDPEEAKEYLEMGIDTILTNNFAAVKQILD